MMLKEYRHGLQTRASHCGYLRLELAGAGENILDLTFEKEMKDDQGSRTYGYMIGGHPSSKNVAKRIGNTARIAALNSNDAKFNTLSQYYKTIIHESGHLIGFDERYNLVTGKSHKGFENDPMGKGSRSSLALPQYRSIIKNAQMFAPQGVTIRIPNVELYNDHKYEFDSQEQSTLRMIKDKGVRFDASKL